MKLSVKGLALSCGIVWGLAVFILTILTMYFGYGEAFLAATAGALYSSHFSISWPGAFVGLVAGFIDGFIGGALLAWLYNAFAGKK